LEGKVSKAARYDRSLLRFAIGANLVAQRAAEARARPASHEQTAYTPPKLTVNVIRDHDASFQLSISKQHVNAYLGELASVECASVRLCYPFSRSSVSWTFLGHQMASSERFDHVEKREGSLSS
jgi:hypothetical protein